MLTEDKTMLDWPLTRKLFHMLGVYLSCLKSKKGMSKIGSFFVFWNNNQNRRVIFYILKLNESNILRKLKFCVILDAH